MSVHFYCQDLLSWPSYYNYFLLPDQLRYRKWLPKLHWSGMEFYPAMYTVKPDRRLSKLNLFTPWQRNMPCQIQVEAKCDLVSNDVSCIILNDGQICQGNFTIRLEAWSYDTSWNFIQQPFTHFTSGLTDESLWKQVPQLLYVHKSNVQLISTSEIMLHVYLPILNANGLRSLWWWLKEWLWMGDFPMLQVS